MRTSRSSSQDGNILFIILLAIVLIGLLTAAIQSGNNSESANIDDETLMIRISEVQRYASELERGVKLIMDNGKSEVDVRFAHPDAPSSYGDINEDTSADPLANPQITPDMQVFAKPGGAATYRKPPGDVNDGSMWEFYAGTAIPGIGTSAADLVAVLPNVTLQFCEKLNAMNGQSTVQPEDDGTGSATDTLAGDCVNMGLEGRFNDGDGEQYYDTPNTMDVTTFTEDPNLTPAQPRPAPQACVLCAADSSYHFYHVLLAR